MKELIGELTTNQTILAMFPLVGLSIILAIVAFYLLWKERREGEQQKAERKT